MTQSLYHRLPQNSIGSFKELSRAFTGQFISRKTHEKSSTPLINLLQERNESLRNYMNRFTKEALKVPDCDEKVVMITLQQGTTNTFFKRSLAKKAPEDINVLQERAGKYIKAEEILRGETQGGDNNKNKRRSDKKYNARSKYPRQKRARIHP